MKKLFLFLFIAFLFTTTSFAQGCLPEGITFSTQEQIDNFQNDYPGCTEIEGDVEIEGAGIKNLGGLSGITSIDGSLKILNNDSLEELNALENLIFVGGYVRIFNNDQLLNLAGLHSITTIAGSLSISSNELLVDLTGLESLITISSYFSIETNPSLISLDGLENLTSVGGYLHLGFMENGNPVLQNIDGLSGLSMVGGDIFMHSNPVLESISGLSSLESIDGIIVVSGNNNLSSLNGLDNISASSISDIFISGNSILNECEVQSICEFIELNGSDIANISNNSSGCNTPEEVQQACEASPCLPGGISFTSQSEIDGFSSNYPECNIIMGTVEINGTDIVNVNGLSNLVEIQGDLLIGNSGGNLNLSNLGGFSNLTKLGGSLLIDNNSVLPSLEGLNNIEMDSINDLTIINNPLLELCSMLNICDYLINPSGNVLISNNALGCNNIEEIKEGCKTSCLQNEIEFWTQEQVDNFQVNYPYCTVINGTVQIKGNDINNLIGLEVITEIGGSLNIGNGNINNVLINLDGLNNLVSIEYNLRIIGFDGLNDLTGLNSLKTIGGDFNLDGNTNMTTINGLDSLLTIDGSIKLLSTNLNDIGNLDSISVINKAIKIIDNSNLTDLSGLKNISSIGYGLEISDNDRLTSLNFSNLKTITDNLIISDNDSLISLAGLDSLTMVGDDGVSIIDNAGLTSLMGLSNLTSIGFGGLTIENNNSLVSLSGLDNIDENSISSLTISNNSLLSTCEVQSICEYLYYLNGNAVIFNNAEGCNSEEEILEACDPFEVCLLEGITFSTQEQINNFESDFPGCTKIGGHVKIQGDDISNLFGLSVLDSIGDDLSIISNPMLVDLQGLSSLTRIEDRLQILSNENLESLEGFEKLKTLGGNIIIESNENLIDFYGLDSLNLVEGRLFVIDNSQLESLSGLEAITSLKGLRINGNNNLTDIVAIENIDLTGQNVFLRLVDNDILSVCAVQSICEHLESPNYGTLIQNNAPGCNSIEEVEAACLVGIEEITPEQISIHPNPATKEVFISLENGKHVNEINIYSQLGQNVLSEKQVSGAIDISRLQPGIYILEVVVAETKVRKKLIVE